MRKFSDDELRSLFKNFENQQARTEYRSTAGSNEYGIHPTLKIALGASKRLLAAGGAVTIRFEGDLQREIVWDPVDVDWAVANIHIGNG